MKNIFGIRVVSDIRAFTYFPEISGPTYITRYALVVRGHKKNNSKFYNEIYIIEAKRLIVLIYVYSLLTCSVVLLLGNMNDGIG